MPADGSLSRREPAGEYDRSVLVPTVVHLGPGHFHRAHQAVYCDAVLRTGARSGAVRGVSLRSAAVRDALAPNDFRYHVVERAWAQDTDGADTGAGTREIGAIRRVGALLGIDVATDDPRSALPGLTDPSVTVVTITVTEHGYCAVQPGGPLDLTRPEVLHDLEHPRAPRSLPGLLVEALARRRAAGIAPFAVASCDNLPGNGPATSRVVIDLAECRDPRLAEWVRGHVAFPSSMVDRMVPETTDEDRAALRRAGIDDAWPVVTEPFSQWVLEDVFPAGRPPWERVGVEFVSDVGVFEQAKLRILNAAHSALACWGLLAGHAFIWQAAADPALLAATSRLVATEILPTVQPPPGWDLAAYAEQALRRFANRALPYTTAKVATDSSQKLPIRVVPTARALLATGRPAPRCAQLLAAWLVALARPGGTGPPVSDAALPGVVADLTDATIHRLLGRPGFFDPSLPHERAFLDEVAHQARLLRCVDAPQHLAMVPSSLKCDLSDKSH